jgi:hypothetical protein
VAFLPSRQTTRQLTKHHGFTRTTRRSLPCGLQLPQSKFPSTTTSLHLMASLLASWPTQCRHNGRNRCYNTLSSRRRKSLGPYVRRSIGLSLFTPGPQPVAQLGRNPRRRSNHRVVVRTFRPDQIHAPSYTPLAGNAVFQVLVTRLPSRPTLRRSLTLTEHRNPQTGGCPWLLTSNLYHLPMPSTAHRDPCCWRRCATHLLHSAFPSGLRPYPLGGIQTSTLDFGLAIRLVVDGPLPSTLP